MMRHRALIQAPTFGRRAIPAGAPAALRGNAVADDLRLFAMTFLGGFLFMSVYLA